jgi:DnaJ-class molecular chaperone
MFEAQIEQQKRQFEKANMAGQIQQKLRSEDIDVMVPISAQELYNGAQKKNFEFKRLVICRGCRADPTMPECEACGRCPPEKVQVPKYGMTPFGRQVVGMKEKEQESSEKCREVPSTIEMRVPKGAKEGASLKTVSDLGHQTPGKIPGRVVFKVQRGSPNDTYTIAENDLHTVLKLSMEQALFGFSFSWTHLGDESVAISRDRSTTPDEVLRLPKKGLVSSGSNRGDLYVRLALDMPKVEKGAKSRTFEAPSSKEKITPELFKEDAVELRDGAAWRRWTSRENAKTIKVNKGKDGKDEL